MIENKNTYSYFCKMRRQTSKYLKGVLKAAEF